MKIKILQYTGGMNRAGVETLLMNIYRNIDRNKYEFHFISPTKNKCDYDDEIIKLGGKVVYLERPMLKKLNSYKKNLKNLIDENGPYDAIHTHMQLMNGFILKTAKEIGINERISHAHLNGDYGKGTFIRSLYRRCSKYLIKKNATKNLACSRESGNYLYDGREFTLLNNAIDIEKFNLGDEFKRYLNKEFNLDDNIKIITHIGRFVEAKNHEFIIKAFSILLKKSRNYRLILCGVGPLREVIEKKVKKMNIGKYVYFLGIRSDINKILLGTDLFLMPSLLEGLPVALVEAQAAGCQCLISENIPKDGDLGVDAVNYLSLEDNAEFWVEEIINLSSKEKVAFGKRREKIIEKGYDLIENINYLSKLYKRGF